MESIMKKRITSLIKKHRTSLILSILALSSVAAIAVKNHQKSTTNSTALSKESSCTKCSHAHKKCCGKTIEQCAEKNTGKKKCRSKHRKQHGKTFKKEESKSNDTETKKMKS